VRENAGPGTSLRRLDVTQLAGAALLSVSAGLHLRLFLGGYRDVHLSDVLGVDLAGSFALAVVTGALLAVALVASVLYERGRRVVALAGAGYALGAVVAYAMTRTTGLLGFEETRWVPEAIVAKPVELLALSLLALVALRRRAGGAAVA
jgi:hypothetical protein